MIKYYWWMDPEDGEWKVTRSKSALEQRIKEITDETGFAPEHHEEEGDDEEGTIAVHLPWRNGGTVRKAMSASKAQALAKHGDKLIINGEG